MNRLVQARMKDPWIKVFFSRILRTKHFLDMAFSSPGDNKEFKKPLQRRRGQRRLNNEFIFYLRIWRCSQVVYFVNHCQKSIAKLNPEHIDKFEINI